MTAAEKAELLATIAQNLNENSWSGARAKLRKRNTDPHLELTLRGVPYGTEGECMILRLMKASCRDCGGTGTVDIGPDFLGLPDPAEERLAPCETCQPEERAAWEREQDGVE